MARATPLPALPALARARARAPSARARRLRPASRRPALGGVASGVADDLDADPSAASSEGPPPSALASNVSARPPETLDAFATRVCARVGRGEGDARRIARTLRENWFETVAQVAALSPEQLIAMDVPARFAQEMRLVLAEEAEAASEASEAASSNASTRAGDGPASSSSSSDPSDPSDPASSDGWVGGPLPGPDDRLPRPLTGRPPSASSSPDGLHGRPRRPALASVRVSKRKRLPPYALRPGEAPEAFELELERLRRDVTSRRVGGGRAPVRHSTANNYVEVARGLMGWYVRCKLGGWDGVTWPEEEEEASEDDSDSGSGLGGASRRRRTPRASPPATLSLRDAIPSSDAAGAATAIAYLQWLCETRGVLPTTEAFHLRSLIALAKWLHGSGGEGGLEKPVVMELVRVQRGSKTLAAKGARGADEAAKWLDWPDYLRLVERLRLECAPLTHLGDQRADRDVALAVQRYLLFAILACVPDRQRTLRELELGRTLLCEPEVHDGLEEERREERRRRWVIAHAPEDYKTGGAYGARPALVLDPRVYPALEAWLFGPDPEDVPSDPAAANDPGAYGDWGHRAALAPNHRLVFTRPNGEPWTVSELSRTFSRAAMRLTGKKTNPHLVRDMVITHVRGEGIASDAELEALSLYMGHSVAMQKGTYDRRTQQQKVAPAIGLMSAINARASERKAGATGGGGGK